MIIGMIYSSSSNNSSSTSLNEEKKNTPPVPINIGSFGLVASMIATFQSKARLGSILERRSPQYEKTEFEIKRIPQDYVRQRIQQFKKIEIGRRRSERKMSRLVLGRKPVVDVREQFERQSMERKDPAEYRSSEYGNSYGFDYGQGRDGVSTKIRRWFRDVDYQNKLNGINGGEDDSSSLSYMAPVSDTVEKVLNSPPRQDQRNKVLIRAQTDHLKSTSTAKSYRSQHNQPFLSPSYFRPRETAASIQTSSTLSTIRPTLVPKSETENS